MATPAIRAFELTAADAGPLRGAVRTGGGSRPAVVICHGTEGFEDWAFHAATTERLARAGFAAVSYDAAAPGDLDVVLAALRVGAICDAPPTLGLLGYGAGGAIAADRAVVDPAVLALVTWEALPSAAAEVRVPWLLVHGAGDGPLPVEAAQRFAWSGSGPGFARVLDATVAWFARHLA